MQRTGLLSILLVMSCGGAEPQPVAEPACPPGSTWNGSACSAVLDTSCPPGMQFVSARGCVAIVAPSPPPPPPPPEQPAPEGGVERTVWIQRMIAELPARVCVANYFQQCFVATRSECEASVAALTQSCIRDRKDRLPRFFDEASGRREGTKIGECVGAAYEAEMRGRGRFVNNAACNDPSRW